MATANPFGNLHVQRDDDDEPQSQGSKTSQTQTPQQLFVSTTQEPKKKKKVRPEKKEEQQPVVEEEGFEEVGKKKKKKRQEDTYEEEPQVPKKEKYAKKEGSHYHIKDESKPQNKRPFDKHSGTGRGKEISKGGTGGKGTWFGNQGGQEVDYNNDDYYINSALNKDEHQREYKPRGDNWDRKYKEKTEEPKNEQEQPEPTTEQAQEETKEEEKDTKFKSKKKKEKEEPEVKKEDLLEVPENAITADEYLKKFEKNKPVQEIVVPRSKETDALEILSKDEQVEIGLVGASKKDKKNKSKKNEKKENKPQQIIPNVQFGDVNEGRGRRDYYQKDNQKKEDKKFHYDPNECPKFTK